MNEKICLVISTLSGGGAEGVCINIANGLAESGFDVTLLVLNLDKADYLERVSKNVNIHSLDVKKARESILKLRNFVINNDIKKYIVFNYELTVLLIIIRYFILKKIVIISRNINTLSKNKKDIKSLWGRYIVIPLVNNLYSKSDHIVNQCIGMKNDLVNELPESKDKVSVIYNPVNRIYEDISIDDNLTANHFEKPFILCVGRLEKQKAFHLALLAFSKISNNYQNLELRFVGDGRLLSELKTLSINLGIQERVHFEGFQENLIPYYLNASMTLMTSQYEGFPNTLIESISMGTPIVSFDCYSGPNEIIFDKKNGVLVEINNVDALIRAIDFVYNEKIDKSLIKETSERFRNKSIICKWVDLINDI
ncbi:TPA: glycosyltransferase [Photobacterium damselae]